jgi:hypothetical protein
MGALSDSTCPLEFLGRHVGDPRRVWFLPLRQTGRRGGFALGSGLRPSTSSPRRPFGVDHDGLSYPRRPIMRLGAVHANAQARSGPREIDTQAGQDADAAIEAERPHSLLL